MGFAVALVAGCLSGCSPSTGEIDRQDENHPMMRKALERKRANDIDGAISTFQSALNESPGLARAHLELGLLFDQSKQDYVRAVYHYQRYLELRPDAEKRKIVEEMVQYAKYSFAASLPDRPSEAIRMIAQLKEENQGLREDLKRMTQAQEGLPLAESATPDPAAPPAAPEVHPAARTGMTDSLLPPPAAARKTVTVRHGDTLSSIAVRVYGDSSQWQKIFDANRSVLKRPGDLRAGQTLVVPPLAERRSTP
jgi:tetratricopeptide (TPR) repeat protein